MMQLTWKVLFSDSSRDHGTLSQLFSLIKRLPAAKKPKEDMHACTDALFTVLKGYIVAAACRELKIDVDTEGIPSQEMKRWSYKQKIGFIVQLSMKTVEKYTLVGESILCQAVKESGDKKYGRMFVCFSKRSATCDMKVTDLATRVVASLVEFAPI